MQSSDKTTPSLAWAYWLIIGLCFIVALPAPKILAGLVPGAGLVFWLWFMKSEKHMPAPPKQLVFILSYMSVLSILSALWSVNPDQTLDKLLKLLPLFLGGCLFISFSRTLPDTLPQDRARCAAYVLPACAVLFLALLTFEAVSDPQIGLFPDAYPSHLLYQMVRGFDPDLWVHPDVINKGLIAYSLLLWPALYCLWARGDIFAACLLWVISAAAVLQSWSMGAQIAVIGGGLLCIFAYVMPRLTLWGLFAVYALYSISFPWAAPWLYTHALDTLVQYMPQGSPAARLEIWSIAGQKIQEQWLTGFGLDATSALKGLNTTQQYYKPATLLHPHNAQLQIWLELGVMGTAIQLALVFSLIRKALNLPRRARVIATGLMGAALALTATTFGIWQGWWLSTLFLTGGLYLYTRKLLEIKKV